jgi:hypothetical protein
MRKIIISVSVIIFITPAVLFADMETFYANVVNAASQSVGMQSIPSLNGKRFTQDCIGYVRYIYYRAGLDITRAYSIGERGVDSLYYGLMEYGFVYTNIIANPGDLVFFNNTYDANRNGLWDDPLTHVGIIESIGEYNTMTYIHYASGAVKRDMINLQYPTTHAFRRGDGSLMVINSHLRRNQGEGLPRRAYIASTFYQAFARINVRANNSR